MDVSLNKFDRLFKEQQNILRGRISALDELRAMAVIIVVWHNVTAGLYKDGILSKVVNLLSNTGWVGVQLFFVLSGFLITGILLDGRGSPNQLPHFFVRRALRIFPLYYFVLFIGFVVLPAMDINPSWLQHDRQHSIWYWVYLVNWTAPFVGDGKAFGHFWSLAVEEQFYLLWPWCVLYLDEKKLLLVCSTLISSAVLIRFLIAQQPLWPIEIAYTFTIARWDSLAVGAAIALMLRDRACSLRLMRIYPTILASGLLYTVSFMFIEHNFEPTGTGWGGFNQTVAALVFGAVLVHAIHRHLTGAETISPPWHNRLLQHIGKYSYGIYVFHLPIARLWMGWWADMGLQPDALSSSTTTSFQFAIIFATSTLIAICSWHIIELPCLRLKNVFAAH